MARLVLMFVAGALAVSAFQQAKPEREYLIAALTECRSSAADGVTINFQQTGEEQ